MVQGDLQNRPLLSDQMYYEKLVEIVICSGMGKHILKRYRPAIDKYFSDFQTVAGYTESDTEAILKDEIMLHNLSKINACITNAKTFTDICGSYGSMEIYFSGFDTLNPEEKEIRMSKDLSEHFKYLGEKNVVKYLDAIHCQQA